MPDQPNDETGLKDSSGAEFVAPTTENLRSEAENELERITELHRQELLEISQVFSIDTTVLSEERDKKISEHRKTIIQKNRLVNNVSSEKIILFDDRLPNQGEEIATITPSKIHGSYANMAPDIVREHGYIVGASHENNFNEQFDDNIPGIMGVGRLSYTEEEYQKLNYFSRKNTEGYLVVKYKSVGLARFIELERISQQNPLAKSFLKFLESNNLVQEIKNGSMPPGSFYNRFVEETKLSERDLEQLQASIDYLNDFYGTFNLETKELNSLMGRLMIEISMIGEQRANYIPEIIDTNTAFNLIEENSVTNKKSYSVDHNFTFPVDQTELAKANYEKKLLDLGIDPLE